MMFKKIKIISLAVAGILLAGDIFSQPMVREDMIHNHKFRHLKGLYFEDYDFMRAKLNFTDDQIEAISKINGEFGEKISSYYTRLQPLNNKLRNYLLSKDIDLEKIHSLLIEISGIEIDIWMTKIKHRIAIENIFNPAQREMLNNEKRWMMHQDD